MDRAAKAVRRSGVKLLSLGGGHTDLNMVISEQKDVKNSAKSFMAAQNSASQYLMKWAGHEENRAIQDVSNQIVELNLLWTEAQREFNEKLKDFKSMFETLLEGEKHIDQAKNNLIMCEQREYKIKKELKKAAKKATTEEIRLLENRLHQACRQKDLAQLEVQDRIRENEAIKIIRFKEGLLKLSEAYMVLGKKCSIVFESQRDIAHQLPDAHEKDLEDIKYTGSGATKRYVTLAKEKMRHYKRHGHMHQTISLPTVLSTEPPPPYTPGDFYGHEAKSDFDLSALCGTTDFYGPTTTTTSGTTSTTTTTDCPARPTLSIVDTFLYCDDEEVAPSAVYDGVGPGRGQDHFLSNPPQVSLRRSPSLPPRQQSLDLAEEVDWASEEEEEMSGAMGAMKL